MQRGTGGQREVAGRRMPCSAVHPPEDTEVTSSSVSLPFEEAPLCPICCACACAPGCWLMSRFSSLLALPSVSRSSADREAIGTSPAPDAALRMVPGRSTGNEFCCRSAGGSGRLAAEASRDQRRARERREAASTVRTSWEAGRGGRGGRREGEWDAESDILRG